MQFFDEFILSAVFQDLKEKLFIFFTYLGMCFYG